MMAWLGIPNCLKILGMYQKNSSSFIFIYLKYVLVKSVKVLIDKILKRIENDFNVFWPPIQFSILFVVLSFFWNHIIWQISGNFMSHCFHKLKHIHNCRIRILNTIPFWKYLSRWLGLSTIWWFMGRCISCCIFLNPAFTRVLAFRAYGRKRTLVLGASKLSKTRTRRS